MRKTLLYTAGAVFLGAVLMLLPLQIFYMAHGEEGPYIKPLFASGSWEQLTTGTYGRDAGKVAFQPADPFVGILGIGFFSALIVYLIFKRRRPYPSYR